jgi:hypothetical protein
VYLLCSVVCARAYHRVVCSLHNTSATEECCVHSCHRMTASPYVFTLESSPWREQLAVSIGVKTKLVMPDFSCTSAIIDPSYIAACVCDPEVRSATVTHTEVQQTGAVGVYVHALRQCADHVTPTHPYQDKAKMYCEWAAPNPVELNVRLFIQESMLAALLLLNYLVIAIEHLMRKIPPPPPKTHGAVCRTPSSVRSLRLEADELTPMKLSRLKVRAREVGITDEQLDDADDADNVKQTVIEMILAEQSATVRSEALHNMKVSELKRLATQAGVSREQIDDADDEPDTRGVIIQLILETQTNEDPDGIEALRTELEEITKIKTLKARARQEGIDREQLDDADDADDVKDTIIKLILHKKQLGVSSASAQGPIGTTSSPALSTSACPLRYELEALRVGEQQQKLRRELEGLRLGALNRRAVDAGVDSDAIEDAMDRDDQKTALIDLVLSSTVQAQGVAPLTISDDEKEATAARTQGKRSAIEKAPVESNRSELEFLRLKELRDRAKAENVDAALLDKAADNDDPKGAVIQLLLDKKSALETAKRELEGLRLKELRARAKEAGYSAELLDGAADSDEPKAAVIALLLGPVPPKATLQPEPEHAVQSTPASAPKSAAESKLLVQRVLSESDSDSGAAAELRAQLQGGKLMNLHKRAMQQGIAVHRIDEAMDSDTPKVELISLLVEHHVCAAGANNRRQQKLRAELKQLKLTALHKRAIRESVDEAELEKAMDSEDPRESVVELLLQQQPELLLLQPAATRSVDKPHFGEHAPVVTVHAPSMAPAPTQAANSHVMLSYQWDHQREVLRVHDLLSKQGLQCWMDITGDRFHDEMHVYLSALSRAVSERSHEMHVHRRNDDGHL